MPTEERHAGLYAVDSTVRVSGWVEKSFFEDATIILEGSTCFVGCEFRGDCGLVVDPLGPDERVAVSYKLCDIHGSVKP